MTSNSKSEGWDFVYVGADDIYLCPAGEWLSYRYTNEADGETSQATLSSPGRLSGMVEGSAANVF